ncbi:MAG: cytochrome c3 family protein [Candidatus Methanoperedens sp.]
MNTLLEFMTFVKGIEYLIVIAFCFGFIALWILVNSRDKMGRSTIVSFVIPLALVFGGGAILLTSSDTSDVAAPPNISGATVTIQPDNIGQVTLASNNEWPTVNKSEYLSIKYGPATQFHKIMSEKVSCNTCHHNSGDEIHACKDCHNSPANPHDSTKPGLKAAYHERCISCHQEDFSSGPQSCINCHTGELKTSAVVSAPNRPHQLTWDTCNRCHPKGIPNGGVESKIVYHDTCLNCHSKGVAGAVIVPEDHAGRSGNTCQGCHKPIGG